MSDLYSNIIHLHSSLQRFLLYVNPSQLLSLTSDVLVKLLHRQELGHHPSHPNRLVPRHESLLDLYSRKFSLQWHLNPWSLRCQAKCLDPHHRHPILKLVSLEV